MKKRQSPRARKQGSSIGPKNSSLFDDEAWDSEPQETKVKEEESMMAGEEIVTDDDVIEEESLDDEPVIEEDALDDDPIAEIEPYNEEEVKMGEGANRNLESGMELLDLDFLLNVVESTEGEDSNEVSMRKFTFEELIRTNRVNHVDSLVLKHYTMDTKGFYSKDIQCAAMAELSNRTRQFGANSV